MSKDQLLDEKSKLMKDFLKFKSMKLNLDMSRGKPCKEQLDLSMGLFDVVTSHSDFIDEGIDLRNYGILDGIPRLKKLMAELMQVNADDVIIGGNSSLNMMFDTISYFMTHGVNNQIPWSLQKNIKFLCPCPGYDRHFAITEFFGFKLVPIEMTSTGPNMDQVENFVNNDESVKGIWCVPKYSNPQGITYSDETVTRFAKLKPCAKDFRIFWDNAYCVHDLDDEPQNLLSIMNECEKYHSEDLPIIFCSTSKITFPGAGVSAIACRGSNIISLRKKYSIQTIGYDKLNQLRHLMFLKNIDNIKTHMILHKKIIKPKFDLILNKLKQEFDDNPFITWTRPKGGYFISVNIHKNCAKKAVELCKKLGLKITDAGATYPYHHDPSDSNLRLAPTYPSIEDLKIAVNIFCLCIKLSIIERIM